jgi:hypothetical protein
MTQRSDIESGRLVYTCNCGWIDTGHANPGGARRLWEKIRDEVHEEDHRLNNHHTIRGRPCFVISYYQGMGNRVFQVLHSDLYLVRRRLSLQRKKEVALAIFIDISLGFERMQSNAFWSRFTDSGFSAEDLTSNLIGFHRAVEGISLERAMSVCGRVSREAAYKVYEAHLPQGIGAVKVYEFFKPYLFPCEECTSDAAFPDEFRSVRPAAQDGDYIRIPTTSLPFEHWGLGRALDFDHQGRVIGSHR